MKSNFLITVFFSLAYFSCAKPNYQDDSIQPPPTAQSQCSYYFKIERLCIRIDWEKTPTDSEYGSFVLRFSNKENPEVSVAPTSTPNVILWMPDMGHGSTPVSIGNRDAGTYFVSNVFFIMKGNWEIRIQLRNGENVLEQVPILYTF